VLTSLALITLSILLLGSSIFLGITIAKINEGTSENLWLVGLKVWPFLLGVEAVMMLFILHKEIARRRVWRRDWNEQEQERAKALHGLPKYDANVLPSYKH
jgi:membrane protein YdbS with pleckstrin-like domain